MTPRRPTSLRPVGHASMRQRAFRPALLAATGVMTCMLHPQAWAQTAGSILPKGTVPVVRGVVSGNDYALTSAAIATGNKLTITQKVQRAIIEWNQFNVASGSEVEFIQPSDTAAALNRIYSADPSIIQGRIKANGQIYLINQNGILFDRGAQVNVHTLFASTLNMSNSQFAQGVVSANGQPSFAGRYDDAGNTIAGTSGAIVIGAHGEATAAAPTVSSLTYDAQGKPVTGGAIILLAPVINHQSGVITSPDGQVVLAAGNKAYLQFADGISSRIAGLTVEIEADNGPVDITSLIRNLGTIQSDRGNVTLAALAVNQEGRISASHAIQHNGSVILQAKSRNQGNGKVTLAAGSITETPLDTTDTYKLKESQSYDDYRSRILVEGATIVQEGTISAPAGQVDLLASNPADPAAARVYLGKTSVIDVSGVNAEVPFESNFLTFKVTSNELSNSPDQKNGILKGATVTVDLRKGSTLLNLSGYQANRERSLAEKATSAGAVNVNSTGDFIQRQGSVINASGGQLQYSGGTSKVTQLIGVDGKAYSITNAPQQMIYSAVGDSFTVDYSRWGLTNTYSNLFRGYFVTEQPYLEGAAAGAMSFLAPGGMVLDGKLLAGTTVGANQLANAPRGGSIRIGAVYDPSLANPQDLGVSNIAFRAGSIDSLGASFDSQTALSAEHKDLLTLGTDNFTNSISEASGNFIQRGFSEVSLAANGSISVARDISLGGAVGSQMALRAQQVNVAGQIQLPAGSIALESVNTIGVAGLSDRGIDVNGRLSTAGLWINNATLGATAYPSGFSNSAGAASSSLNGGTIALRALAAQPASIALHAGSVVDVSGGGSFSSAAKLTAGNAGRIELTQRGLLGDTNPTPLLEGSFKAYALGNGGSFKYTTDQLHIAPVAAHAGDLTPDFFSRGGFSSFELTGIKGVQVVAGTVLRPQQTSLLIDNISANALTSGSDLEAHAQHVVLPDYQRKPVSLSLAATEAGASVVVEHGASIVLEPQGNLSLSAASGNLDIDGVLSARGGKIALSASAQALSTGHLHLGADAVLDVSGVFVAAKPNAQGLRQGNVLNAGSVSLTANNAQILADAGSLIKADGAAQVLDLAGPTTAQPVVATLVTSDAGSLAIQANSQVKLGGQLSARAQGRSAGGGFSLGFGNRNDFAPGYNLPHQIVVSETALTPSVSTTSVDVPLALAPLKQAGFDKLRLSAEDTLEFRGSVVNADFKRGVTLDSQQISVADDAQVNVNGAAIQISNSFGQRILGANSTALNNLYPNLPVATRAGAGEFKVHGNTVDLTGNVTVNGVARTVLESEHDLRLNGRKTSPIVNNQLDELHANLKGSLTSVGNIEIKAAQVYPSTRAEFALRVADGITGAVVPDGSIRISSNGNAPGAVLSAGGTLSFSADHIEQGGVVKAPLGTLDFNAGSTLDLLPSSVTSVSAKGLLIPYGGTDSGVTWLYASTGAEPTVNAITAPPEKQIKLAGVSVNVQTGATVDIAGGGDILGIEFVPGSGGAIDALIQPNTYAILPASLLSSMPVDTTIALKQDLGFAKPGNIYDSIHIATNGLVPVGDYVLLPGYYALLPGAYLVQVQSASNYGQLQPGQSVSLPNGLNVLPAWRTTAGTDIRSQQTIGLVVRPGSDALKLADYNLSGSDFFVKAAQRGGTDAPVTPNDAGRLGIAAQTALSLNGNLSTAPSDARGHTAEIDISGQKIAIVDHTGRSDIDASFLQIDAGNLSRINGSVLVGGTRTSTAGGVTITPTASDVIVANDAGTALQSPELLLASTDRLTVQSDSVISGSGGAPVLGRDILIDPAAGGSGAFMRVANSGAVDIQRTAPLNASAGSLNIESNAKVSATGSMYLDATRDTVSAGVLNVASGGALGLASSTISIGDTPGGLGGLVLDPTRLAEFTSLGALTLKSYGNLDVYGANVALGSATLKDMRLDASAIVGHAGASGSAASLSVAGKNVSLVNTTGAAFAGSIPAAGGQMVVNAGTLNLGKGDKAIAGFSGLELITPGELVEDGVGQLRVGGTLDITAGRISGGSGANQTWSAGDLAVSGRYYDVSLKAHAQPSLASTTTGAGAQLIVEGANIDDNATIVAKSGNVTLAARGVTRGQSKGVELGSGAVLDVSGFSQDFKGTVAYANAGSVTLVAEHDGVSLKSGSRVNVAGADTGGDAGALSIQGPSVSLEGQLAGTARAGQKQGQFKLDVNSLDNFSALNTRLNQDGFSEARELRVRTGNVTFGSTDTIAAHTVRITTDSGDILMQGGSRIDASGASGGGVVDLVAQGNLTLAGGSVIDASATATSAAAQAPYANGGTVSLATRTGTLTFADNAMIDVRAGEKGKAGAVNFTAPRTASNDGLLAALQGKVLSQRHASDAAARINVDANRVYTLASGQDSLSSADIGSVGITGSLADDNVHFMQSVDAVAIAAGIKGDDGNAQANVHVRPAVEIRSAGSLQLADNWDLTNTSAWIQPNSASAAEAGTLTIRAAGDLVLNNVALGLPDNRLYANSWNINLVGGADLAAAQWNQTLPATQLHGVGDVVLAGANARVTSGTGTINIAAGRDFRITDKNGVVYTSGRDVEIPGTIYSSGNSARGKDTTYQRWATDGGNISITAQHDAIGTSNEWITEWLRYTNSGVFGDKGAWWVYRDNFHQNVGALGGGNVSIAAGHDVNNLSVMLPTSGRVFSPNPITVRRGRVTVPGSGPFSLDVQGGGDLAVASGNDVIGGEYLVARGKGLIKAAGSVGTGTATQLYVMGESHDVANRSASIGVEAGGGIALQSIDNPTALVQTTSVGIDPSISSVRIGFPFYTYSAATGVNLVAKGGDISLYGTPASKPDLKDPTAVVSASGNEADLPAQLSMTAFKGSISGPLSAKLFYTFPSSTGFVSLLAGKDIGNLRLTQSDLSPASYGATGVHDWFNTVGTMSFYTGGYDTLIDGRVVGFSRPGRYLDEVVALGGSVSQSRFKFPGASRVWAGQNISDVQVELQQFGQNDISEIVADQGFIHHAVDVPSTIVGPGRLLVQAGGDIDFGANTVPDGALRAITSTNADGKSARLTLIAGVRGDVALDQIDAAYVDLIKAGTDKDKDLAAEAAKRVFGNATITGGNIYTYLTAVQTEQGSDIDLLAPKGNIVVGLTTPPKGKTVGIITTTGGAVRSYLSGNFDINQGKVLTAQGGDILIYTTDGSIDAGRGAKTSVVTPPPQRVAIYDASTPPVLVGYRYVLPAAASGSGIQTITSDPDGPGPVTAPKAGDIYLFAPAGTIDAGEAGIASSGNIVIAAQTVLNASNISASGASVGVPQVETGSLANSMATGGSTTSSTSKAADEAARSASEAARKAGNDAFKASILTVEVLGFGENNCKEGQKDCLDKK